MTQLSQHFSLSACALAASLLLSACGGGESTDTVAPTLAITDSVDSATATGPVTFTFTFSEDVGSSFAAEDITVTGGTAGTLTKVDALHYTLVVTPAASSSGTLNVSVAALRFTDLALNGNTVAASAQQAYDTMVAATEPTVAAATPTALAANVLSIYSDAYTPIADVNLRPDWGQSTQVSEVTIAGNKTQLYTAFNYEGITFAPTDVSAMTKLHIDVWTPDLTALDVYVLAGGAEQFVKLTPTLAGWNSFDINLSDYTTLNKTAVKELKLVSTGGSKVYLDNIYFWKAAAPLSCGTTEPTCAPNTVIPAGSVMIYSDAGNIGGLDPFPNWSQNPPVVSSEPTIAGNKVLKYTFGALYQGIDWSASPQDVSGKGMLHLDVWSANVASVKVSLIGGGSENGIVKTLTAGSWNSIDIDMAQYTSPDKTKAIQVKLEPNVAGTIYVDNLHFHGTAAGGGGGGSNTFTGGIFSSDYSGNLGAGTAKSDKGGAVGFFQDPRLFANKAFEDGSVCGVACNPGGVYNFYYGIGKLLPALTDAYFGAYVNAPGDTSADASAYSKVKLKFWGDAESWEKQNFTAQVDVVLQGPTNAACTNPSGRPEITKAVSAQKIGAGSDYIIPKTDFALTANCGGAYTVDNVWSAVGAIVIRLSGTNLQYLNTVPSTPVSYPTFLNIGPIAFIN
jgi:Bacterial Ig-like domain